MTSDSKLTPRATRSDTSNGRPDGEPPAGEAPADVGPATSRQVSAPCEGNGTHPPEQALAEVMADLLSVEQVPVENHFFGDLGADSWLLGVRIGSRVFDDGCYVTERTTVAIGDACTLNTGSVIQCHSQEDGAFKSDGTTIGSGCTLGVGAFVHYGVTVGDGAVLAPDCFLMKGEVVPRHSWWGGNPARELDRLHDAGRCGR